MASFEAAVFSDFCDEESHASKAVIVRRLGAVSIAHSSSALIEFKQPGQVVDEAEFQTSCHIPEQLN